MRRQLEKITKRGDRLSRRFALLSLARAGARLGQGEDADAAHEEVRALLIQQLAHGRSDMKAWAALGLAVYGHTRAAEHEVVSKDVALAL